MSSTLPLPSWGDLISGLLTTDDRVSIGSTLWSTKKRLTLVFSRSTWSMSAIASYWTEVNNGKLPNVWLPDYFCNGSTSLLRAMGVTIEFYPIDNNLEPNWLICEELANGRRPDLFFLVHYFGRRSDLGLARKFCDNNGSLLVEDAAHCLSVDFKQDLESDFTILSPYKLLPLPECGILSINKKHNNSVMETIHRKITFGSSSIGPWVFYKSVQKLLPDFILKKRQALYGLEFDADQNDIRAVDKGSVTSGTYNLLAKTSSDIAYYVSQRKLTAKRWRERVLKWDGCSPLFSEQEEGEAPYRFCLKFKEEKVAREVYKEVQKKGIAVETWPDLSPEVASDSVRYRVAHIMRHHIIFLPTHNPSYPIKLISD
ncbi:MAG: hypothetical protein VX617_07100 [Pseudomonadota bacterium]|nr:hypothetical protein [Pseudomonadota bacterium]